MKVRIDIDTRTFVRFWLVVIGFALAAFAIYSARTALIIIGVAFFLALALSKPVNMLARKLPGRSRVGATAIAYVFVVLVIGVGGFLVVPPLIEQTAKFAQTVPDIVDKATNQWHGLEQIIAQYNLQEQVDASLASLKESTASWASNIGTTLISSVGSLFSFIASLFLVLVLSFLMLVEGPTWLRRIWSIYPDKTKMENHRSIVERMYNVVTGYVVGQLSVSAIGGTATGLAVFALSFFFPLPANLAIPCAVLAFLLSLIPMFGATIGGVLISLILLLNDPVAAIIFAVYFIVYQQIENNLISPAIQSRKLDLSALVILVSVTIGLYLFGLAGGIISIPIAGCIKILVEEYLARRDKNPINPEKPAAKLIKKIRRATTKTETA